MVAVHDVVFIAEDRETAWSARFKTNLVFKMGVLSVGLRIILTDCLLRFSVRRCKLSSFLFRDRRNYLLSYIGVVKLRVRGRWSLN